MKNIIGTFVGILMSLISFLVSLAKQSTVACCVSGIVGTENIFTSKTVDYMSIAYSMAGKCSKFCINQPRKRLFTLKFFFIPTYALVFKLH